MKLPIAETCCCGCSLRSGSIIIGLFTLVGAVCTFIRSTELYTELEEIQETNDLDPEITAIKDHIIAHQLLMFGCLVFSVVSAVLSFTLLVGLFMERRRLVRVWVSGTLAVQSLTLLGSIVYCLVLRDVACMSLNSFLAFHLYFVWIVHSYTKEMGKETTGVA